ncbi:MULTISPECIES: 5-formyltetrahydrofolate cyclo-ligase [Arthrobacter]|uniref:5-formyltetrahydrofolate cyclo-ligase n=2 Tax=Arthrobacter TaxID=1663 RepID=A0ABU9KME0_9MICC|nr:5-formyltetrahydrofolate cyclo-ligase [Arthrobacter sp. YJM1]MDP5227068.1 5-formyltetrahydrofolate cyclo-ligase [Arthrobacter sp. YJM1]
MTVSKPAVRSAIRLRRRLELKSRTATESVLLARGFASSTGSWIQSLQAAGAARPAGFTVACYLSGATEPPTTAVLDALHARAVTVLLPVCRPEHRMDWVVWEPGLAMRRSDYAPVDEPVGDALTTEQLLSEGGPGLDAVLLPATAVDAVGNRLGQGGGYYDRFLEVLAGIGHRIPTAALVYSAEVLAEKAFPVERFDRPMDAVISEAGWAAFPLADPSGWFDGSGVRPGSL